MKALAVILAILLLFGSLPPVAIASPMSATMVTGHVVLNGISFNNVNAEYPLLLFRDITYIPLTYDLARFMGLTTQWSQRDGLEIARTASVSPFIADENTINRAGRVTVTLPTYRIRVNGRDIRNRDEQWPLLNFRGVTYFPLTWRFAVVEFGWQYSWQAATGLRVTSTTSADIGLENLLAIVNAASFTARDFTGELHDKADGSRQEFTAATRLEFFRSAPPFPERAAVFFGATPFVFASIMTGFVGQGRPEIMVAFDHMKPANAPFIGVSGNYVGMGGKTSAAEFSHSERAYLLRCFLRFRFIGAARHAIESSSMISSDHTRQTWRLVVAMPDEGFMANPASTTIVATITIEPQLGLVREMLLENDRYALSLTLVPLGAAQATQTASR